MKAQDNCGSRLLDVAVYAVNQALGWALEGKSPLNTTLHAGNYEIDLWGCNAGLGMDASVRVAGFEGTSIQSLTCGEQEGDEVTVTGRLTFGADIDTDAKVAAQWSLCGLDLATGDSEVDFGVHSRDPGLRDRLGRSGPVLLRHQQRAGFHRLQVRAVVCQHHPVVGREDPRQLDEGCR